MRIIKEESDFYDCAYDLSKKEGITCNIGKDFNTGNYIIILTKYGWGTQYAVMDSFSFVEDMIYVLKEMIKRFGV